MAMHQRLDSFKVFIFDFDGTLVDTSKAWRNVDKQFFASRGIEYDFDQYFALIEGKTLTEIARITNDHYGLQEDVNDILLEYNRIYESQFEEKLDLVPGALEFLQEQVERGRKMAIATSCPERLVQEFISRFPQLETGISVIVSCEEVGKNKPSPDVYLECLRLLGETVDQTAIFEDSLSGIRGAHATGAFVVGVSSFDERNMEEKHALSDLWINQWCELLL